MRVAALYDIHGNLPALEAVLKEVRDAGVDRVVIGGDVLPGPMPRETLWRLFDLNVPVDFIHGNGDRVVVAQMTGGDISEVPPQFRDGIRWTAERIHPFEQQEIASWPSLCRIDIPGLGGVLFCHATPRNDTEIFTKRTSEHRLAPAFASLDVPIVVCGHTHMQFERMVGRTRVVNAGSVGMPFAPPPGAHWLLLGPDIQFQTTLYDLSEAAARIRETTFPQVEDLAVRYVLDPPSEAESLSMFDRTELT